MVWIVTMVTASEHHLGPFLHCPTINYWLPLVSANIKMHIFSPWLFQTFKRLVWDHLISLLPMPSLTQVLHSKVLEDKRWQFKCEALSRLVLRWRVNAGIDSCLHWCTVNSLLTVCTVWLWNMHPCSLLEWMISFIIICWLCLLQLVLGSNRLLHKRTKIS